MPNSTEPSVVFITGATSGLGLALADHFSRQGWTVYGSSRQPDRHQTSFPLIQLDLRQAKSITAAIQQVVQDAGRLDVLINNAGVGIAGPLEELPDNYLTEVLQTNLLGLARTMQAVLPIMRRQGQGKIINISSVASEVALPYRSMYSASKAAVNRMTESLRMEIAPFGIQATCVLAGDMRTPINQHRLTLESDPASAYADIFSRAARAMNEEVDKGVAPETVARRIEQLARKKQLGKFYTVGKPLQRAAVYLARILPGNVFEQLLRTYSKV